MTVLFKLKLKFKVHRSDVSSDVWLSHRHRFFEDVEAMRAQERARNEARRMEVLERRQRQMEEVAEKKRGGGS